MGGVCDRLDEETEKFMKETSIATPPRMDRMSFRKSMTDWYPNEEIFIELLVHYMCPHSRRALYAL